MARKNLLTKLTEPMLTAVNSGELPPPSVAPSLSFSTKGALGAVTRSIDDLAIRANAAKVLEAQLTSGQMIVELDPALIEGSFIADRMLQEDAEYFALRGSIAQTGQDSPILVRPHPENQGRYQVAFGHRRLRIAKELGRPVRAVVRNLSDRELVLAQGQENSARANLSFIERARFAHRLETIGYDRETIMAALTVDKTTLSRLISVVTRIPAEVIDAIGPAAGTGRDRWVELANLFQEPGAPTGLTSLLGSDAFRADDSDARFQRVFTICRRLDRATASPTSEDHAVTTRQRASAHHWRHSSGACVMRVTTTQRSTQLTIDNKVLPGFGEYLLAEMENLVSVYLKMTSVPDAPGEQ